MSIFQLFQQLKNVQEFDPLIVLIQKVTNYPCQSYSCRAQLRQAEDTLLYAYPIKIQSTYVLKLICVIEA